MVNLLLFLSKIWFTKAGGFPNADLRRLSSPKVAETISPTLLEMLPVLCVCVVCVCVCMFPSGEVLDLVCVCAYVRLHNKEHHLRKDA
jgi:hypothetical protein